MKTTIQGFNTYLDLNRCVDSMLFNSETLVASLFVTKGDYNVSVKLKVVGDVAVLYRNKVYHSYFDFPTGLKERIEQYPRNWQHIEGKQDVQINLNNWFEYQWVIHGPDYFCKSGSMLCEDDLHLMTEDALKAEMLEVADHVIQENPIPTAQRTVVKIHSRKITDENIKRTMQVLRDNGMDEDQAHIVLQAIGYTLLEVELFAEDK